MQAFLASDVVYAQRVAPLIKEALDDERRQRASRSPASRFLPRHLVAGAGHRRLAPGPQRERRRHRDVRHGRARACTATASTRHEHRRRHAAARGAGRGQPRPVVGQPDVHRRSSPTRATTTSPTSRSPSRSSRRGQGRSRSTKTIGQTKAKQTADGQHPARRRRRRPARRPRVTVAIAKVPGEKNDRQQPLDLHGHLHALSRAPARRARRSTARAPILRGRGRPLHDHGDRRAGRRRAWRSSR